MKNKIIILISLACLAVALHAAEDDANLPSNSANSSLPQFAPVPEFRPAPEFTRSYVTWAKTFCLSATNREDQESQIRLVSVNTNGLATLELLKYSETVTVSPSNLILPLVAEKERVSGHYTLMSSSFANQTVTIRSMGGGERLSIEKRTSR